MTDTTTISLTTDVRDRLFDRKRNSAETYEDVIDRLGESTRVGAVEASCEFTQAMLPALAKAVEHEDMTEELAEALSTRSADIEYRVETGITVD